jgi:D-aminopeptidase
MLAAIPLPDALTSAGKARTVDADTDMLFWVVVVVVTLALGVMAAIAISNWRAERAIRQARADWAASGLRNRVVIDRVRPDPLRRK